MSATRAFHRASWCRRCVDSCASINDCSSSVYLASKSTGRMTFGLKMPTSAGHPAELAARNIPLECDKAPNLLRNVYCKPARYKRKRAEPTPHAPSSHTGPSIDGTAALPYATPSAETVGTCMEKANGNPEALVLGKSAATITAGTSSQAK